MAGLPDDTRFVSPLKGHGAYGVDAGAPRPNIVVISVDMIPPEAYRCDGLRPYLHLPNLDRLQADCVTFTNAFCPSPLCGPSRAAYMTGRYPYLTVNEERAHDGHEVELRRDDIIFPEYLRADGYVTRHVGKCHVGAAKYLDAFTENAHPWNRWAPPLTDDDEYHQYLDGLGVGPWRYAREIVGRRPDGSPGNSFGGWVEQVDGRRFPIEATYPYYLATRASRTLRTVVRRTGRGRPIYLQLDFFAPHQPFVIPAGLEDREAALRQVVALPESFTRLADAGFAAPADEPKIYGSYRRSLGLCDADAVRDYVVANLLQVEVIDRALGLLFDALTDEGLYDDALIVLTADHGEMNGERALVDKGVYGHPKVMRAPLMLHLPGGAEAGREVDTPVSLLDLAPTVLGRAGINPHERLDGVDLVPLAIGEATERDQDFLFEAGWHVAPNPAVAIQHRYPDGRHFVYTYNLTDDRDELYDLADATYANLANDAAHAAVRQELVERLADVLRRERRWRCYWHAMRVGRRDLVGQEDGDQQMIVPD